MSVEPHLAPAPADTASAPPRGQSAPRPGGLHDPVAIGRVRGCHGVRGELKVEAFGDTLPASEPGRRLVLARAGGGARAGEAEGDARTVTISSLREVAPGRMLLGLAEVHDRDEAAALVGLEVRVERSELEQLEDDEYYASDLIGITVVTEDGAELGTLSGILDIGPHDVYAVRDGATERMIPALKQVVRAVDLDGRRMVVHYVEPR